MAVPNIRQSVEDELRRAFRVVELTDFEPRVQVYEMIGQDIRRYSPSVIAECIKQAMPEGAFLGESKFLNGDTLLIHHSMKDSLFVAVFSENFSPVEPGAEYPIKSIRIR